MFGSLPVRVHVRARVCVCVPVRTRTVCGNDARLCSDCDGRLSAEDLGVGLGRLGMTLPRALLPLLMRSFGKLDASETLSFHVRACVRACCLLLRACVHVRAGSCARACVHAACASVRACVRLCIRPFGHVRPFVRVSLVRTELQCVGAGVLLGAVEEAR